MSDDTNSEKYRVTGNNHYHDGERLMRGDVFVPSEAELEAFESKLEKVEDEDVDVDTESADEEEDTEDEADATNEAEAVPEGETEGMTAYEFVDHNASEVADAIRDGEADGHLDEVETAESEGKDRSTVHNAIETRRGQLEAED